MIISDKYRYIFVEFPQTGCSAVATELMANYSGRRILFKHAQYSDFAKKASEDELNYFSFSTIRHPMDIVVSKYFKYKTNHKNYVDKKVKYGRLRKLISPSLEKKRRDFVVDNDADFESFFMHFYTLPYSSWSITNHPQLDYVMRFENLAGDFGDVLRRIGIEPIRELPLFNKTDQKKKHFSEYYQSPEVKERAIRVFSPYMAVWGYEFPSDWNVDPQKVANMSKYKRVNLLRKLYWKHLR